MTAKTALKNNRERWSKQALDPTGLVEKSAVLVEKRRWDFHYEAMAGSLLYHQLIIHQQDFTD